jgi:hypothetical protein
MPGTPSTGRDGTSCGHGVSVRRAPAGVRDDARRVHASPRLTRDVSRAGMFRLLTRAAKTSRRQQLR